MTLLSNLPRSRSSCPKPHSKSNIRIVKPYEITRHPDTLHFTYLDTVGRPVINLEKDNLVEFHSQPFTIYYDFNYINILREPFIAVLAFLGVFGLIILFNRFDFSIARSEAPATHSKTELSLFDILQG
uniref:Dolichyl-diphosphooligosaccharide--protein glycosyltransferase subunit 1 n=1 Tax=Panagrellus redivivus TaxID=6233 RepID=A0A7E4VRR0_PANRE